MFAKLGRILLEFEFLLDFLSILARPVHFASLRVLEFYQIIL